mgnify:CR=1 FL=1
MNTLPDVEQLIGEMARTLHEHLTRNRREDVAFVGMPSVASHSVQAVCQLALGADLVAATANHRLAYVDQCTCSVSHSCFVLFSWG